MGEDDLTFSDLAEDIAIEARLALSLTEEIKEFDEHIEVIVRDRDPDGIITSAPGIGAVTGAVILGRLGDASRFSSLAAARSFSGLVPCPPWTPPVSPVATAGRRSKESQRAPSTARATPTLGDPERLDIC